jgi:hypothetical protein
MGGWGRKPLGYYRDIADAPQMLRTSRDREEAHQHERR